LNSALIIGFIILHVPLALVMYKVQFVATLHAWATVAVGLLWALSKPNLERAAYVGAYIIGAEVLWRMTHTDIFWETGKYGLALIFIAAMLRSKQAKLPPLPLIYLLLLLPSVFLTVEFMGMEQARKTLSFNLSTPFALMVSIWFFSNVRISREQLGRLFLALIGPIVGIASITLFATVDASLTDDLNFGGGSNTITSGGFGPNQVSAILGFGVLVTFLLLVDSKTKWSFKCVMLAIAIFLAVQSALTFSRSGLFLAVGSGLLASLFLMKDNGSRGRVILTVGVLYLVANFIFVPFLDSVTDNAFSSRFQDTDPTGRDLVVQADLQIWAANPILGVGPGVARAYRSQFYTSERKASTVSHTEFSRLLAEHGILGGAALLLLLIMTGQILLRAQTPMNRALVVAMTTWSFLFMLTNSMRLAAPAFAIGLGFATILAKDTLGCIPSRSMRSRPVPRFRRVPISRGRNPNSVKPVPGFIFKRYNPSGVEK
jgi:hypothetical protein